MCLRHEDVRQVDVVIMATHNCDRTLRVTTQVSIGLGSGLSDPSRIERQRPTIARDDACSNHVRRHWTDANPREVIAHEHPAARDDELCPRGSAETVPAMDFAAVIVCLLDGAVDYQRLH